MVRIHQGAVDLVRRHNLLPLLCLVALPDTTAPELQPHPNFRSGHPLLMAGVTQVLSTLWATLLDSTTRKCWSTQLPEEPEFQPEEEDEEWEGRRKRKRNNSETFSKHFKKAKNEDVGVNNSDSPEADTFDWEMERENSRVNNDEPAEKSHIRVLPHIAVQEYLNCLKLLAPSILSIAPVATCAKFLILIEDTVKYADVIAAHHANKHKFYCSVLNPKAVRQQVSGQ